MIFKMYGLVLITVGPAIIIMGLAYVVPFVVTFILVLCCCSYLLVNSIIKLVRGDGKPAFPLYFVLINFVSKALLLTYVFGMQNGYGIEHHTSWLIAIYCTLLSQLIVYLL